MSIILENSPKPAQAPLSCLEQHHRYVPLAYQLSHKIKMFMRARDNFKTKNICLCFIELNYSWSKIKLRLQ